MAVAMVTSASVTIAMLQRPPVQPGHTYWLRHQRPRLHSVNDIIRTLTPDDLLSSPLSSSVATENENGHVVAMTTVKKKKSFQEVNPKSCHQRGKNKAPCKFSNKYES